MKHQHLADFIRDYQNGDTEKTPEGILFPRKSALIYGHYISTVNGRDRMVHPNLLPDAGILRILNIAFGAQAKESGFYLALFAGAVDPVPGWTAANFAANSSENVSTSQGYASATRPAWAPNVAAAGAIDNVGVESSFAIVATTSITVNGAALLSSSTRGGTGGTLFSAARFAVPRTLYNGDNFGLGYRVTLVD
jgi:hypothetical protein